MVYISLEVLKARLVLEQLVLVSLAMEWGENEMVLNVPSSPNHFLIP